MTVPPPAAIRPLIGEAELRTRVAELAARVSADCAGRELLVIGILKGSFVFMADLVRRLTVPVRVDFVSASSYGSGTRSSGAVRLAVEPGCPVEGRDVLLVEDILDTGLTLRALVEELKRRNPASLRVCVLLDKPARREVEVKPDYVGFEVPDRFVVGYGVDVAEHYRNLPYVGYVDEGPTGPQGEAPAERAGRPGPTGAGEHSGDSNGNC